MRRVVRQSVIWLRRAMIVSEAAEKCRSSLRSPAATHLAESKPR